jgi:putative endonuclease
MGNRRRFDHLALGRHGEDLVERWYVDQGHQVIARNWRCRSGELDLVVRCGAIVVFCEVKTRSSTRYGSPFEAVDRRRRARMRAAAAEFLRSQESGGNRVRFDVAAVIGESVDVIRGAF